MRAIAAGNASDTDGDRNRSRRSLHRAALDDFDQLLRLCGEFGIVAAGQENQELLSSVAPHGVIRTNLASQPPSYRAKDFVAHQMSSRVIDPLEMIDIRQKEPHRATVSSRPAQLSFQQH